MYFLALATDYDGTLAHDGVVERATVQALERFKSTGRRVILVTGRELPHLKDVFPDLDLFDLVVAENGALVYDPHTKRERVIGPAPPAAFVERLRQGGVTPLSVGRVIIATWDPHGPAVLSAIRDFGLEHQIIFNKGAVMVLPPGVNKAAGLEVSLRMLGLSSHNVVAVGDAENDHAFLHACGCSAAVANALPLVKEAADIRLSGDHGAGVCELMERVCREDAGIVPPERHGIALGTENGREIHLEPYGGSILVAGRSGIGKSTLATALTERMAEKRFEFCVLDPEGDYDELEHAVSLGDAGAAPSCEEALKLLDRAGTNVVINTQALDAAERPGFFAELMPQIATLRARTGRPHWLLIDEAHHLLPQARGGVGNVLPEQNPATIFITVHPEAVSLHALKSVDIIVAVGEGAPAVIETFCRTVGVEVPRIGGTPGDSEVLVWRRATEAFVRKVKPRPPEQSHKRHAHKYAEGNLGPELSFYFRGPREELNLRAQNLTLFLQIAEGVDDDTWIHHLRRGDYSHWFREVIKNDDLATEAAEIEADHNLDASQSRARIKDAIKRRYTAPTEP